MVRKFVHFVIACSSLAWGVALAQSPIPGYGPQPAPASAGSSGANYSPGVPALSAFTQQATSTCTVTQNLLVAIDISCPSLSSPSLATFVKGAPSGSTYQIAVLLVPSASVTPYLSSVYAGTLVGWQDATGNTWQVQVQYNDFKVNFNSGCVSSSGSSSNFSQQLFNFSGLPFWLILALQSNGLYFYTSPDGSFASESYINSINGVSACGMSDANKVFWGLFNVGGNNVGASLWVWDENGATRKPAPLGVAGH